MTKEEEVQWLYAIETCANAAGDRGQWEAQDFFIGWFADLREGCFQESRPISRYGWSADPQTDRELREKYGTSIHERR